MFAVVLRTGVFRRPLQGIQPPRKGKPQREGKPVGEGYEAQDRWELLWQINN